MSSGYRSQPVAGRADLAWNLAAMICSQGTTFLSSIVTANLLGREVFGQFASIQQTQFTLASLAQLASWLTASKFLAEYHVSQPAKAAAVLRLCHRLALGGGAVGALVLLGLAPWLAKTVYDAPHLASGLMITAATVLFAALGTFQMGAMAGLGGHRPLAMAAIGTSLVYLPVSVVATLHLGLNGAVIALLVRFATQWLIQDRLLRRACARHQLPRVVELHSEVLALLWRFALPAAIAGCFSWPVLWLGTTVLARQEDGFNELALYTAANTLRMLTLFLPFTISNFAWSRMNHHQGLGNVSATSQLFRRNLLTTGALAMAGSLVVVALGPLLLPLFGKSFGDGAVVLNMMMIAAIPEALTIAAQQAMHSQERIWRSLAGMALPRDLTIVAVAYWLIPIYGAVGLALALLAGWSLALVSSLLFVRRHTQTDEARPTGVEPARPSRRRPRRERATPCQN